MESDICPVCRATAVVHGQLANGEQSAPYFVPNGGRAFRRMVGVGLKHSLGACLSCGHLWTSLSPEAIRSFIEDHGRNLARQQLATLDEGPYRDLPDIPEAREAGRAIAEIDGLMLGEMVSRATRLYRETTGTTWDQAIAVIRRWRDLTRAEKLEIFGWAPKATVPVDDWANPFA